MVEVRAGERAVRGDRAGGRATGCLSRGVRAGTGIGGRVDQGMRVGQEGMWGKGAGQRGGRQGQRWGKRGCGAKGDVGQGGRTGRGQRETGVGQEETGMGQGQTGMGQGEAGTGAGTTRTWAGTTVEGGTLAGSRAVQGGRNPPPGLPHGQPMLLPCQVPLGLKSECRGAEEWAQGLNLVAQG